MNLETEQVGVSREPGPGGRGRAERLGRGATVEPGAFPDAVLAVSEVLG